VTIIQDDLAGGGAGRVPPEDYRRLLGEVTIRVL
jgi:hypothetical protein